MVLWLDKCTDSTEIICARTLVTPFSTDCKGLWVVCIQVSARKILANLQTGENCKVTMAFLQRIREVNFGKIANLRLGLNSASARQSGSKQVFL